MVPFSGVLRYEFEKSESRQEPVPQRRHPDTLTEAEKYSLVEHNAFISFEESRGHGQDAEVYRGEYCG